MIVDVGLARDALRGITVAALPVVHLPLGQYPESDGAGAVRLGENVENCSGRDSNRARRSAAWPLRLAGSNPRRARFARESLSAPAGIRTLVITVRG